MIQLVRIMIYFIDLDGVIIDSAKECYLFSKFVYYKNKKFNFKKITKFSTIYGAVNGGNSLSDVDVYSVTNGLQTQTVVTPYDYSGYFRC